VCPGKQGFSIQPLINHSGIPAGPRPAESIWLLQGRSDYHREREGMSWLKREWMPVLFLTTLRWQRWRCFCYF